MKTLIISLLFTGSMSSLFAQSDSTASPNMSQAPTINGTSPKVDSINNAGADTMHTMVANSSAKGNNSNATLTPVTPKNTTDSTTATPPASVNNNSSTNTTINTTTAATSTTTTTTGVIANATNVQGQQGYASLPVLESYVPDAVVAKAKEKYGTNIYDITSVKHGVDQAAYVVRYQDNGAYKCETISADGTVIPQ